MYRFELFRVRNSNGRVHFYWRMCSSNNRVLATSETYTKKHNAHKIVRKLITALGEDACTYKFIKKGK